MNGFESYLNPSNPREQKVLSYIETAKGRISDEIIEQIESEPAEKDRYLEQREGEGDQEYRTRLLDTAEKLFLQQTEMELAAAEKGQLGRELTQKAQEHLDREPKQPLGPELRSAFSEMSKDFRDRGNERLADLIEKSLEEEEQGPA